MPNRLSKILSRSFKEKEAEAEAERNASTSSSSSPPPGYDQAPPDYDAENRLDPPDATAGFARLNLNNNSDTPQVNTCIAHLKVLECFYRLRQTVGATDGLFGIDDSIVTDHALPEIGSKTSEVLAKLAEKRWAIYVCRAVARFEAWSAGLIPQAKMLTTHDFDLYGHTGTICDLPEKQRPLAFTTDNLPPVDVLMVWHAYQLNPRAYLEDCLRLGRMQMWHAGFPWQPIVECINPETFEYTASEAAQQEFKSLTFMRPNQLDDVRPKDLQCPGCKQQVTCKYTTVSEDVARRMVKCSDLKTLNSHVDDLLSSGTGYSDRDFAAVCPHDGCETTITHERFKAEKFCHDLRKLIDKDVMMPGTLLGYEGIPWKFGSKTDTMFMFVKGLFIPDFFKIGLGQDILRHHDQQQLDVQTLNGIRQQIEKRFEDQNYLRTVKGNRTGRMNRGDRVMVRKMMSRYWENSSPFALDLIGAVIRQGGFIEKMHNIDWIHSPALQNTMKRLLVKYVRFITIMKDPIHMAVPTLDVDLAWHTHQLSPPTYMAYTIAQTRQFIDHDDKIAETALNDAFAWTSKTYQKLYSEPYSECTCWYCEAIRESHTSTASRLFQTSSAAAGDKLHDSPQDPRKSVHISNHNMVRPDDAAYRADAKVKAAALETHYLKACARARKKGRPEPKRDDYYYSDAYGYPVYIPAYSPYIGFYPYMPMYYPMAPACMAVGVGAAGNCCSGTCGGGVAAGACAHNSGGGGGCAGGAAGGCGGAGAGGCGGGGGCAGGGGGGCGGGGGGCGGGGGG